MFFSPKQARTAFGTYLERIQIRLMLDSELKEDVTSSQHMELVLRFLKRAGLNLVPVFRVEIPSRRLSIADQKRILAKQLADFLHLYNKETLTANPTSNSIDPKLFETFLRSANEADLEQIMTTYMKTNQQSSIHLGVHPKTNPKTPSNNQQQQQQQANDSIHSSDLPQDRSMTSNTETTTATVEVKPAVRASSASRTRSLPQQQKRQDEIYRVYGITRPLSAVVQHRKRSSLSSPRLFFFDLLGSFRINRHGFLRSRNEITHSRKTQFRESPRRTRSVCLFSIPSSPFILLV